MAYSVYLDIILTGRHFAFDIKYPTLSSWNIPAGYLLPTCWILPAYLLDTSCLPLGYLLPTCWVPPAYLLDTSCLPVGHFIHILASPYIVQPAISAIFPPRFTGRNLHNTDQTTPAILSSLYRLCKKQIITRRHFVTGHRSYFCRDDR